MARVLPMRTHTNVVSMVFALHEMWLYREQMNVFPSAVVDEQPIFFSSNLASNNKKNLLSIAVEFRVTCWN